MTRPRLPRRLAAAAGRTLLALWLFVRFDNLATWLPRNWGWKLAARVAVLSLLAGMGGAWVLHLLSSDLPTPDELSRIEQRHIASVYDTNGLLIKQFYTQQREPVSLDRIPRHLKEALLATEDRDFYQHWGIHLRRFAGAAVANLRAGDYSQGASTITQQLARNIFEKRIGSSKTITRKLREQLTAVALECNYSKDEILQMYLNQMYYANGAWGIQQAARNYFGRSVEELDVAQSAYLVGVLQRPHYYYLNPDQALRRRNLVLQNMVVAGYLDAETAQSHAEAEAGIIERDPGASHAPYFVETIRQYIERTYGEDMLYRDGATIQSTLDWEMQEIAERHLMRQLDIRQEDFDRLIIEPRIAQILKDTPEGADPDTSEIPALRRRYTLQGALVALDPANGDILALIGGRDFAESEFNRAIQANRQAGSAFKPFLYTAALDNGYTPASRIMNQPITLPQPDGTRWTPTNYYDEFGDALALRDALRKSINLIAARLVMGAGAGAGPGQHGSVNAQMLVNYARQFGITTPLRAFPSLSIGSGGVHLIEMVSAYSTFANLGVRVQPRLVREIYDYYGREVENRPPIHIPVIEPALAYLMVDMMKGVMQEGGTAQMARTVYRLSMPAAGKTGTTNDYTDAWFIGFTPRLVVGVWIGFDEHQSMQLPEVSNPSGAVMALPVWSEFIREVYASKELPQEDWVMPPGLVRLELCRTSIAPGSPDYKLALPTCPDRFTELFLEHNQPTETCRIHDPALRRGFRIPPLRFLPEHPFLK